MLVKVLFVEGPNKSVRDNICVNIQHSIHSVAYRARVIYWHAHQARQQKLKASSLPKY